MFMLLKVFIKNMAKFKPIKLSSSIAQGHKIDYSGTELGVTSRSHSTWKRIGDKHHSKQFINDIVRDRILMKYVKLRQLLLQKSTVTSYPAEFYAGNIFEFLTILSC